MNQQITKTQGDIVLLNDMSSTLTGFAGQVDTLKSALNTVVEPWAAAETYLEAKIQEITSLEQSTDWANVEEELQQLRGSWNDLMTSMQGLKLDPQISPSANLSVGMNEAQVQQVLNNAPKLSLAQYLAA